jgi:hypothetical protein
MPSTCRKANAAVPSIQVTDCAKGDLPSGPLPKKFGVGLKQLDRAGADCAQTGHRDAQRLRHRLLLCLSGRRDPAIGAIDHVVIAAEERLDAPHRLADPMGILDESKPNVAVAVFAKADPG